MSQKQPNPISTLPPTCPTSTDISPSPSSGPYQKVLLESDARSISSQKTTGGESFKTARTTFSDASPSVTSPNSHNEQGTQNVGLLGGLFGSFSLSPDATRVSEEISEEELKQQVEVAQESPLDQGQGPRLRCRIGPSLDTLGIFNVNEDADPQFIDSNLFMGRVAVRVKDFKGITRLSTPPISTIPYFEGKKRMFSIQVQGRFKQEFTADDILFGVEFKNKVIQPYGSWIAMKLASLIDPGITSDFNAQQPWCFSPLLSSMNLLNVVPCDIQVPTTLPTPLSITQSLASTVSSHYTIKNIQEMLGEWNYTGENLLQEDNRHILNRPSGTKLDFKQDKPEERRKYFQKQKNRQEVVFRKDFIYNFEIYAPFIDLNTFDVSLGIKVNLVYYLCNQPLVFKAKSKSLNRDLFTIEMQLV